MHHELNFVKASFKQNDVFFVYSTVSKCQALGLFWGSGQMYSRRHVVNIDFQPLGLKNDPQGGGYYGKIKF